MAEKYKDLGAFLHVDEDMKKVGELSIKQAFGIDLPDGHPLKKMMFTLHKDK